ncbi:MAG: uncharacterized protein QOE69_3302 [Thermoleophilaceae bacterium]|jgi:uncharacterized protein YqjF (DUF2071 family)|nr:uncharacterized protein [Thermoleophilaceae bacterium]
MADESRLQRRTLEELGHRPWPLPGGPWLQGQTWCDLLFAHWRVPAERLRRVMPPALASKLNLYEDGSAWLGITPFVVQGLRLRGTPPLPWVSHFPELNVRTYVELDGRPGIYFFSLDAGRRAAVLAARRTYRLPYFHARMRAEKVGARVDYESERTDSSGPPARFRGSYGPVGPRTDDPLARWLAERYCAYTVDGSGQPLRIEIHHPPWPLQPAEGQLDAQGMAAPLDIDLEGDPLLHFSARQDTLIWPLKPA